MFKAIAIYWIAGCLLAGAAEGAHKHFCPKDEIMSAVDIILSVATWPASIGYAFVTHGDGRPECKVQ